MTSMAAPIAARPRHLPGTRGALRCRMRCRSSCWRRRFAIILVFVYGFILWTIYLSFTRSRALADLRAWRASMQYERLWAQPNWWKSRSRTSRIFGSLYIVICIALGLGLAILLDQRIRAEGVLRADLPLPDGALVHRHRHGLEVVPQSRPRPRARRCTTGAWTSFKFDWIINQDMAIYTVVIAGVWQASGFVMAMFLAGLRGIDSEIIKAAQIDGARTSRSTAASSSRCCGRCSCRPSSCSRTWRSSPTTWSSR